MTPTMLNLFFVQEMLKPVNPPAWENFLQRCRRAADPEKTRAEGRASYWKNPEKRRAKMHEWKQENSKSVEDYAIAYRKEHAEKRNTGTKKWRQENPKKSAASCRAWNAKNPGWHARRSAQRRAESPEFKLLNTLRNRLTSAMRGTAKESTTRDLLGTEIKEFKIYLQGQFLPGMAWENHGTVWHIDHIRPCASFDLIDPAQQCECFNWSNCQPLFAEDNLRKGAHFSR